MPKLILIFSLLLVSLTNSQTQAQAFKIESFDGGNGEISVTFNENEEHLKISYLKDAIYMDHVMEIKSTEVLHKRFLKITYSEHAGTGIHMLTTLVLSIGNKRLCQSMHIISLFKEEFIDFSKKVDTGNMVDVRSIYKADLTFAKNGGGDYKVEVKIHDKQVSKHHSASDHKKDINLVLLIDPKQHIFYNSQKRISQYYTFYDPKTDKQTGMRVYGTYPEMRLGQYIYYYIKGEWYQRGSVNELSKYAYR
jgi:hypothetical protein